jgi:uncharacterized membrane protein
LARNTKPPLNNKRWRFFDVPNKRTPQKLEQIAQSMKEAEDKHQDVLQKAKEKAIKILEEARLEEKTAIEALRQQQTELADREKSLFRKKSSR